MKATHLEIIVEEPSMEAFLMELLPRALGDRATFLIHVHQGKADLLRKLEGRLRGYARWLPDHARVLVLVDRDDDNCLELKRQLEDAAAAAGLISKSSNNQAWQIANRIAVEEVEAWYFGEWSAVRTAYPKLGAHIPNQAAYRHCDAIAGGTWEAIERVLKKKGYFTGGLRKVQLAMAIGRYFDPTSCNSPSFLSFHSAMMEAIS